MGKVTAISWCDHTFNAWEGCERVSPACARCYAADRAVRWGKPDLWAGRFEMRADAYWRKPLAWNAEAEARRQPSFVFCASLADVFQAEVALAEPRERLWRLIHETPWLVWLLLTKRPENIAAMLPWPEAPHNVWLGTSVENARYTWRARRLVEVPAPVHFLSCEPLLGSLFDDRGHREPLDLTDIEWVVIGGESGRGFRPLKLEHAREVRDACRAAGVPVWFKQVGGRYHDTGGHLLDGEEIFERPEPAIPALLTLF